MYNAWCEISGTHFDYRIKPKNASESAPCERYQNEDDEDNFCWPVTLSGVAIHGQNINNLLWAVFGQSWGWPSLALEAGAHVNQMGRYFSEDNNNFFDTPGSQYSIVMGCELYDALKSTPPSTNPYDTVRGILTAPHVFLMRDADIYGDNKLWPCSEPYDTNKSRLVRPSLIYWK